MLSGKVIVRVRTEGVPVTGSRGEWLDAYGEERDWTNWLGSTTAYHSDSMSFHVDGSFVDRLAAARECGGSILTVFASELRALKDERFTWDRESLQRAMTLAGDLMRRWESFLRTGVMPAGSGPGLNTMATALEFVIDRDAADNLTALIRDWLRYLEVMIAAFDSGQSYDQAVTSYGIQPGDYDAAVSGTEAFLSEYQMPLIIGGGLLAVLLLRRK